MFSAWAPTSTYRTRAFDRTRATSTGERSIPYSVETEIPRANAAAGGWRSGGEGGKAIRFITFMSPFYRKPGPVARRQSRMRCLPLQRYPDVLGDLPQLAVSSDAGDRRRSFGQQGLAALQLVRVVDAHVGLLDDPRGERQLLVVSRGRLVAALD